MAETTTDRRRKPRSDVVRNQRATDSIAAAWAIVEAGYRSEDGRGVAANKARAVEHLEAAIRAIRGKDRG